MNYQANFKEWIILVWNFHSIRFTITCDGTLPIINNNQKCHSLVNRYSASWPLLDDRIVLSYKTLLTK